MSTSSSSSSATTSDISLYSPDQQQAVRNFQTYLQCKTVHPAPEAGYAQACEFFRKYSKEVDLQFDAIEYVPGHPIILMSWIGSEPNLPSIILSSHMDVVPVDDDKWKTDAWAAKIENGNIYGRGTQDMKSVTIQYCEAIRNLKLKSSFVPKRSIHILIVPDEEVGGNRGMKLFLTSEKVKELNPAFVLDEGLASPTDKFTVFYGERKIWWCKVTATGAAGHGSRFIENTAVPKLVNVINRMLEFREEQKKELDKMCSCGKQLGDYTSINCTMLNAGNTDSKTPQYNVIPTTATAGFDIRIPATEDLKVFKEKLDIWCSQDTGVTWEVIAGMQQGMLDNPVSDISSDSYWWNVFSDSLRTAGAEMHEPSIFPAATDSRWIRLILGVPCFGFSPIRQCPILLHDHDEFIPVNIFLEGIKIYEKLIPRIVQA